MKKLLTFVFAVVVTLTQVVIPVSAANYTAIPGTTTKLEKALIVKNDAEIPDATFTFTASAGAAIEATATTVKVWAGLNPELVKINSTAGSGTVSFTAGETKTAGAANDTYANSAAKSYAKKDINLDFTGINYAEPGVYRYIITETTPTSPIHAVDATTTTVDVYVQDVNGALEILGYVAYEGTVTAAPKVSTDTTTITTLDGKTPNGAEAAAKDDKFRNEVNAQNIEFGKEVTGNQGSKDQYFKFTVTLGNLGANTVLTVLSDAEVATPHANTATSYSVSDMTTANTRDDDTTTSGQQLVADSSGAISWDVYLHDGQYVKIQGLPEGATYSVTEENAAGYTKSEGTDKVVTGTKVHDDDVSGTIDDEDIYTGYTNDRQGVLPTGLLIPIGAGILLLIVGAFGLIASRKRKCVE